MGLLLHSAWRASAPYRVRIGLNLKGLSYDYAPVDLVAGEQGGEVYGAVNAQHLVPALEADGHVLTQSLSILEWLDETYREPPLLPKDPFDRQVVRAMSGIVACDIHPLNNLHPQDTGAARGRAGGGRRLGAALDQRRLHRPGANGGQTWRRLCLRRQPDHGRLPDRAAGLQRPPVQGGPVALPGHHWRGRPCGGTSCHRRRPSEQPA